MTTLTAKPCNSVVSLLPQGQPRSLEIILSGQPRDTIRLLQRFEELPAKTFKSIQRFASPLPAGGAVHITVIGPAHDAAALIIQLHARELINASQWAPKPVQKLGKQVVRIGYQVNG